MKLITKNKKGNMWGVLYFLVGIVILTSIYVIFTPVMDELFSTADDMVGGDSDAKGVLDLLNTIWYKLFIGIMLVGMIIYVIVSSLRKEPYQNQY